MADPLAVRQGVGPRSPLGTSGERAGSPVAIFAQEQGPSVEPFLTLALHGHGVELTARVPQVARVAAAILGPLVEPFLPGEPEIRGSVLAYEEPDVLRQVSPDAIRIDEPGLLMELYRDPRGGERLWLVDERWGICEINLLKRIWRSWVLPSCSMDAVRLFEATVMWPMAQLLRGAGLHVIPAAAMGKNGRGVLILSPFDVGPEIEAVSRAGVGIIGQRWTALREEAGGRVSLLHVPGRIERAPAPRLLSAGPMGQSVWVDLAAGRTCHQATCELVLLVEPMRRSEASVTALNAIEAREQLKMLWPIPQLSAGASPKVTTNLISAALARTCSVQRVRLSRNGADLARLLVRAPTSAAVAA